MSRWENKYGLRLEFLPKNGDLPTCLAVSAPVVGWGHLNALHYLRLEIRPPPLPRTDCCRAANVDYFLPECSAVRPSDLAMKAGRPKELEARAECRPDALNCNQS